MTVRTAFVVLALLLCCGTGRGEEGRWRNFAEDADLRYFLDQKSVRSLPDNVYLFWVKSVGKGRDYYRREYNLHDLSYIVTNYEIDCAVSSYRIRGSILLDKNRREISKTVAGSDVLFEPVPPESMLELAEEEICKNSPVPKGEDEVAAVAIGKGGAAVAASGARPRLVAESEGGEPENTPGGALGSAPTPLPENSQPAAEPSISPESTPSGEQGTVSEPSQPGEQEVPSEATPPAEQPVPEQSSPPEQVQPEQAPSDQAPSEQAPSEQAPSEQAVPPEISRQDPSGSGAPSGRRGSQGATAPGGGAAVAAAPLNAPSPRPAP